MTRKIKFGTDGWRSIIADEFTFDNVELVTKAIVGYIKQTYSPERPVVIGYDTRFLANKFAERAAKVINSFGLNVKLTKRDAPTPVVAFSAKELESAGALMFTASHNPPEYCGIKYIPDYAGPATPDITDIIVSNVEKLQNGDDSFLSKPTSEGVTEKFDPRPAYMAWVRKIVDLDKIKQNPAKVYYDPMYSTGRGYLDELLKEAGCDVTVLHDWIDPLYGGSMPEPKAEYLSEVTDLVKKDGNAIGFGTDGDADRFGVIDETGAYYMPNFVIAVLLRHLIKNKGYKGSIVRTVATTHMLDGLAEEYGLKIHETPVGFKHIGQIMRQEDVVIGGEESGGLSILHHIPEKDGIVANLSIVEAMAYEKKPLKDILKELKEEVGTDFFHERLDLKVSDKIKVDFVKMCGENPPASINGIKVKKVSTMDGAKLYLEDGTWILTRPSGTEPLLRIYFEAHTVEGLKGMIADMKKLLEDMKKKDNALV
jgi:phosphomannomutase